MFCPQNASHAAFSLLQNSPIGSNRSVVRVLLRKLIDPAEETRSIRVRVACFRAYGAGPGCTGRIRSSLCRHIRVKPRRDSTEPGVRLGLGGALAASSNTALTMVP